MIAPVAELKTQPVNRVAKNLKPKKKERDWEAERRERSRIEARCNSMFNIIRYEWGVELSGYLDLDEVPSWLHELMYELWITLPARQQETAERLARRFHQLRPDQISDAASLRCYNRFVQETLEMGAKFCRRNPEAMGLLSRVCSMLDDPGLNGVTRAKEWDSVQLAAEQIAEKLSEGSPLRCMMAAIIWTADREMWSAMRTWCAVESAFGRGPAGRGHDFTIRRSTPTLLRLADRVLAAVKKGRDLTKSGAAPAAQKAKAA